MCAGHNLKGIIPVIIKSNFKDYYDSCVGFGIDKGVVFSRKQEKIRIIDCRKGRSDLENAVHSIEASVSALFDQQVALPKGYYERIVVGFCGKLYTGLVSHYYMGEQVFRRDASLMNKVLQTKNHWVLEDFTPEQLTTNKGDGEYYLGHEKNRAHNIADWFKRMGDGLAVENAKLFFDHGITSFSIHNREVVLNPSLKDIGFSRVVDGVTAFQEVSMHVASLHSSAIKQPEPISDKLKALSKGFNDHSFRSGPGRH